MEFIVAQMLSGISLGGQYALIAIGYTMVYGILRLINFAHGDVFMCAGLMMVFACASSLRTCPFRSCSAGRSLLGFIESARR